MDIFRLQDRFLMWRARLYSRLVSKAFAAFGQNSLLFYPVRVWNPKKIHIGSGVHIESSVWINAVDRWAGESYDSRIVISDDAVIMNNVQISAIASIFIGKGASVGRNSTIVDHNHDFHHLDVPIVHAPLSQGKPVVIEEEVMLAVNCVVGPGVTIGKHSFVAAGSLVTTDIPPYSFASGVPAKVIRTRDPVTGVWEKTQPRQT